jgi:hypothetical protein
VSFFFIDDAPAVSSMAFQTSATSTGSTITCPTVQQYDVGVLIDYASNNFSPEPTQAVPSGFTSLATSADGARRGTASYKVFDGTESGAALAGLAGGLFNSKVLLVFRPNTAIGSVTASTWLTEATTGNPTAQSIAASGGTAPLIRIAGASDNNSVTPSFSAGTFDGTATQSTGAGRTIAGYAIQNSVGSDDSVDMNDLGANWLVSGWLSFT